MNDVIVVIVNLLLCLICILLRLHNKLALTQLSSRRYPRLKEVDDVLGGAAAWENVDSTESKNFP